MSADPPAHDDTDPPRPDDAGPRRVLSLSAAALVVLVAEPLYLLVDTAVVGRLGAFPLAALAVGAVVLAQVSSLGTFLAYGTTARAARAFGAGDRDRAVAEGAAATWLALLAGLGVVVVGEVLARPLAGLLGAGGPVADAAVSWLRIALCGAPGILVAMAGNGWMRGVQSTRAPVVIVLAGNGLSALACPVLVHGLGPVPALGLEGSALANVAAQGVVTVLFLGALRREGAPWRPVGADMRAQLGPGRDLLLRSAAFQACFLSATAVAARFGAPAVAAHQIVLQLWVFMTTTLDSLAIAAQSLVGAALGRADPRVAREVARRVTGYGLVLGVVAAAVFAVVAGVLPRVFTADAGVLRQVGHAWWFFVALQPVAAYVFALDGVLLGAGDAAALRRITVGTALGAFLPTIWLSLVFGWGLAGVWAGLSLFVVGRAVAVGLRVRGDRWMAPGAVRPVM